MVDDLLDLFRLSHRKMTLREAVDLAGTVRRTAEDYQATLDGAGLSLKLELPPEPVWVSADRMRLTQVVSNLLRNAVKFTNRGGCVTVRVEIDLLHQCVRTTVQDTGIGLTPEVLSEIFEMFAQGRQNLARKQGGLGLGLALVKGLVELHDGQVSAASAGAGQGATFSFWLPLGRKPTATTAVSPPKMLAAQPERPPMRLLIVEDNEDTAETLQLLLKCFGHEVRMAHTGPAGIRMAKGWHPDVILCDLGLPEMDGYEVASDLRHDPATAATCLIAISGYGQEEDRRRSHEVGFDMHLTKPVDPLELKRLLTGLKLASPGIQ